MNNHSFLVNVDVQEDIWTAECSELGLVTEADSYEALVESAYTIAPELAELNGFHSEVIRLRFDHKEDLSL